MEVLFITKAIETFTTEHGVVCNPIPYNDGFILPLGWEFELQNRNITFEVVNYVNLEEEI